MPIESRLLSIHIEKAAGTSVQEFLESILGKNRVLIYNPITNTVTRSCDLKAQRTNALHDALRLRIAGTSLAPLINKTYLLLTSRFIKPKVFQITQMPKDFTAIHGHFPANRFDACLTNPLTAVVIREPLERMKSQYAHWHNARGITEWRVRIPFDPALTFEEYALLPELQNYQTQALAGKRLASINVVGVTSELDAYSRELLRLFRDTGIISAQESKQREMRWLNKTPGRITVTQARTPEFIRRFRDFHSADYQLYFEAKTRVRS